MYADYLCNSILKFGFICNYSPCVVCIFNCKFVIIIFFKKYLTYNVCIRNFSFKKSNMINNVFGFKIIEQKLKIINNK